MTDGARILVVDDSEANQLLASAVLERDGYQVSVAGSGAELMRQLGERHHDLILMDVRLGGEDGLSLTRQLKAEPDTSSIPVVALTAHVVGDYKEQCLEAGCAGYISKPIDVKTFGSLVGQFLAESRAAVQADASASTYAEPAPLGGPTQQPARAATRPSGRARVRPARSRRAR